MSAVYIFLGVRFDHKERTFYCNLNTFLLSMNVYLFFYVVVGFDTWKTNKIISQEYARFFVIFQQRAPMQKTSLYVLTHLILQTSS